MLSRRLIRIKVMQALYAYYQSEPHDSYKSEKDLFNSLDKVYESYLYLLLLLTEMGESARMALSDAGSKHITTNNNGGHDRLTNNQLLQSLSNNSSLIQKAKQQKLSWQKDYEQVQKLFVKLRKSEEYKFAEAKSDLDMLTWIVKRLIAADEVLNAYLEERYIYWSDDKDFVISMIIKTLKGMAEKDGPSNTLPGLYKDEEDDVRFTKELLKKTIYNDEEYEKAISEKAANWEAERIALTDMILMKMCLAEITTFSQIPVKVSINEYLDIAKNYSTPKSNAFINGIIDKLVIEWKASGKIVKTGRGLIEN